MNFSQIKKIFMATTLAAASYTHAQEAVELQHVITPNIATYTKTPRSVTSSEIHTFQVPAALIKEADTFISKVDINKPARDEEADKDPEERDPAYLNRVKPEHQPKIVEYKQVTLTFKKNVVDETGKYYKQNFNIVARLTRAKDGQFYYIGHFLGPILNGDEGEYVWGVYDRNARSDETSTPQIKQYLGVINVVREVK